MGIHRLPIFGKKKKGRFFFSDPDHISHLESLEYFDITAKYFTMCITGNKLNYRTNETSAE